ncbi:MAG: sugar phosphate isomerase/epimerase [Luminiphilus sp.]
MPQTLEIYQSLWGMEQRIPGQAEDAPEVHLRRIAGAGYHGACLDPNVAEIPDCLRLKPLFEELELGCMVNAFPHSEDSLEPLLDMAAEMQATQLNIIAQVMPLRPDDAAPIIERWLTVAAGYPFPVLMETHRNSTLNDLFYTLEVLARVPQLRLCADLSHFVVDRELQLPLQEQARHQFSQVIERSDSFQGRISNNQQIQIAIDHPQHAQWVEQYLLWWQEGFSAWSQRNNEAATLRFLVELGPPPYAITDGQQRELSDRWQEGLQIREWVEAIWQRLQG